MQSTSYEMPRWMNHKLESNCWEKYQHPQISSDTTLMAGSEEKLKNLLKRVKEESRKFWPETKHSKN